MSFVKFTHAATVWMMGGLLLTVTAEASVRVECKDIASASAVLNALERELSDITENDFSEGLNSVLRTVTAAVDDIVEDDFAYDKTLNGISNELVRAYKNEDFENYKHAVFRLQSRLRHIKNSKCLTR